MAAASRAAPPDACKNPAVATAFDTIDWQNWTAVDVCTLVFVMDGPRILLIRKKRGLGAGKINGPGGRQDPGETIEACGVREVHEEVGLRVRALELAGVLRFQFADGYSTHVHVYRTDQYEGEAKRRGKGARKQACRVALDNMPGRLGILELGIAWLRRSLCRGAAC